MAIYGIQYFKITLPSHLTLFSKLHWAINSIAVYIYINLFLRLTPLQQNEGAGGSSVLPSLYANTNSCIFKDKKFMKGDLLENLLILQPGR